MSNRIIKFRVWDKQKKEFFPYTNGMILAIGNTDQFVGLNAKQGIYWIPNTGQKDLGWDRWVIQQFTGIQDIHGKEIYEGDVVRDTWESYNPYGYYGEDGEPDWQEGSREYIVKYEAPKFTIYEPFRCEQSVVQNHRREVIGNIHENESYVKKWNLK